MSADHNSHDYRYLVGRRTNQGNEICEYYKQGRTGETITVIAHGRSEIYAQVICNYLNQRVSGSLAKPVTQATSIPGGY